MSLRDDDIVRDILLRIQEVCPEFTDEKAERVESDLRHDWGGERPFVAKLKHRRRKAREKVQMALSGDGNKTKTDIAAEAGMSRSTLYRMIKDKDR